MKHITVKQKNNLVSTLVRFFTDLDDVPDIEDVQKKATDLARLLDCSNVDLESVVQEVMSAVDMRMGAGVSLIDIEVEHDEDWVLNCDDINWIYTEAYEEYLRFNRWSSRVVQSLSVVGTRILGHLQNPKSEGEWDRRGLVIGHVQSGKTANYLGLIAKAADAGYKFIVVIAGIHNNLRKQTQERIDEGFVGRSSDPEYRERVGVGINPNYPCPATLTNIYHDFNKQTAAQSGWQINDFSKPIIIVIKKNVRTLQALYNWLREMNAEIKDGRELRIKDVPMLMIDDEADNASINTNKEDLDPTKTNAMIRRILRLFMKSCYVGYTATPFANIFINPESYDNDVREELFPRDFIYCLDPPNYYFGPDKVFLEEDASTTILRPINDCEDCLPLTHKKNHELQYLPPTLHRAILQFVIIRAIRNLRGQNNSHCSMMVNVSRFVQVQKEVRLLISIYMKHLCDAIKGNYAMPDRIADSNRYFGDLKQEYNSEFKNCGFDWKTVKRNLHEACNNIRLFVVNSQSDETLDYKKYEKNGECLNAIAVGGLSLSRGLTIEGLSVSYMYRNTRMYDTLMQMGRWFGYRTNYADLCRVHLSQDSIDWYSYIAEASDELRQQIIRMRSHGLGPKQFGLYVLKHPKRLQITAANKMYSGQKISLNLNFSGNLVESYFVPTDKTVNEENEELIAKFWQHKFQQSLEPTSKGWVVKNVPTDTILEFLHNFKTHKNFSEQKTNALTYLQEISTQYPNGDVLLISIKQNEEDESRFRLGSQKRNTATMNNSGDAWLTSKHRVASRGDEKLGLTNIQLIRAKRLAKENGKTTPSDYHYRAIRQKPLLMIHVLDIPSPHDSQKDSNRVPAFGISFPEDDYTRSIQVVANPVLIKEMYSQPDDSPAYEDDFDD